MQSHTPQNHTTRGLNEFSLPCFAAREFKFLSRSPHGFTKIEYIEKEKVHFRVVHVEVYIPFCLIKGRSPSAQRSRQRTGVPCPLGYKRPGERRSLLPTQLGATGRRPRRMSCGVGHPLRCTSFDEMEGSPRAGRHAASQPPMSRGGAARRAWWASRTRT